MPTVTLLKTIPSGSHNAPYSEELGEHWPEGQKFKLLSPSRQESARRFHRTKATSILVEQIGGEEVLVAVPVDRFLELFGVHPPVKLPTLKDGDVMIPGPNGETARLRKVRDGRGWTLKVVGVNDHARFGNAKEIQEDIIHFRNTGRLVRGERW